jgi:hypothetical protein
VSQGIRFTGGANDNPTVEMDGKTYVVPLANPKAFEGSNVVNGRQVIDAAATLTADDCGALCLFNLAAGFTYTLPAAQKGLWFDFLVTVTVTSVAAKVICASGDFILGGFIQSPDGTDDLAVHAANGTTHVSWNGNGTTTGGYQGDFFRLTAISGTQWVIQGLGLATGSEDTPFATS